MIGNTLRFILHHPVSGRTPLRSLARYAHWQVTSAVIRTQTVEWVGGTRLVVSRGMTGATGNIYAGLHEFADMAFVLHLMQPGDTFLDIGANVGSYSVLASGVRRARSVAFEPDAGTARNFLRNIAANGLEGLVTLQQVALGHIDGEVSFTTGRDTMNKVARPDEVGSRQVPLRKLDGVPGVRDAVLIKIDVEGFEAEVLAGAGETLSSPSLIALETEGDGGHIPGILARHGFSRVWYEPFRRQILDRPGSLQQGNALFVRDRPEVARRVAAAPPVRVLGLSI